MILRRSIAAVAAPLALGGSLASQSPPADLAQERSAFAELASYAGGSDAAQHTLTRHGIQTDLD